MPTVFISTHPYISRSNTLDCTCVSIAIMKAYYSRVLKIALKHNTSSGHIIQYLSLPSSSSKPLHYDETQPIQTSALQILQTQTPKPITDSESQKTKPSQQVTTNTPTTWQSTTTVYNHAIYQPSSTTKTTPSPSYTSTNPQTRSQTFTQPISEKTTSSTLTQTLQITSYFHYTSAYRTPSHSPTTPTRPTATTPYSYITGHLLWHSTTSLLAPLQTNDHLEAQSPHITFNHTQNATTTLSSTTGTIHPSPATTRHPHQPTASSFQTTSPYHTKILQSGIHTPHITIQLPTHGLPHRPHADTTLSTQPATILRHTITTTPTTGDPSLHEHTQLQTATGDSYYSPTESKLASTTLATLPEPQHPTSHHPPIPTSPRRSPSTQPGNAPRQCSGIPGQSNGHHGLSLQLHQIHLPPHLPEQEHLESSTHKTPGVITAPINALRRLQIHTRNIPKWDHRVLIAGMYSSQLQRYSGGGLHTHWLFLLGDLGPHTGCSPQDRGQSQSVS